MGIISIEKADRLFWLGRYVERVFTTLNVFFDYFDKMLDSDEKAYIKFCEDLSIPPYYEDRDDFIAKFLFSKEDENSVYSNTLKALDNAIILRDEINSQTLAYIQLCLDCVEHAREEHGAPLYSLQPLVDYIYAFRGCMDDTVEDEECRNIIKCGIYLERLDLYMRLDFPYSAIEKTFSRFSNRLHRISIGYNFEAFDRLTDVINLGEKWRERYNEGIYALWDIFG